MNLKLIMMRTVMTLAVAGGLSACSGSASVSVGGGGYNHAWYDVYGNYCGSGDPMAGCNFYADGSKIRAGSDPYYSSHYYQPGVWTYTDSYGYYRSYAGSAWLSSSGILYDSWGNALNESNGEAPSADVIAAVAAKEQQVAKAAGKIFAQKYALAEDKGVMISQTLQDWATIGRDRSRTEADVADVSKRLYGIDATRAKTVLTNAFAMQSQQPLEDLNVDVAAHWGTSPEVSKQILKNWYKDEVAAYGIK